MVEFQLIGTANYGFYNHFNGNFAMSYNTGRWGLRLNYNGKYEKDRIDSELDIQRQRLFELFPYQGDDNPSPIFRDYAATVSLVHRQVGTLLLHRHTPTTT
ncbi:MAG: hypothetical protein IKR25_02920 [Muribaculaceae bacterium]|nr:hypothetical protein [Muribaculaceae bacterium]